MERRGCGLGFIVATLGLLLSCCLFPHLISSIYAIISTLLQEPMATTWLWGDWLSTLPLVKESQALYMMLAEGPICCAGSLALLVGNTRNKATNRIRNLKNRHVHRTQPKTKSSGGSHAWL